MTASEMVLEFKLASDNLDSSTIPDLDNEVILYYLNEAQMRFVKNRYTGNNLFQLGFQQSQKRNDDLNNITKTYFVDAFPIENGLYKIEVSPLYLNEALSITSGDKYMFYLRSQYLINKVGCASKWSFPSLYTLDEIGVNNPYTKSRPVNPSIYFEEGGIFIIAPDFEVVKGKLTCIKKPRVISNDTAFAPLADCELAEHTHKEIIAMAVALALGDIQSEKVQIKTNQNNSIE